MNICKSYYLWAQLQFGIPFFYGFKILFNDIVCTFISEENLIRII